MKRKRTGGRRAYEVFFLAYTDPAMEYLQGQDDVIVSTRVERTIYSDIHSFMQSAHQYYPSCEIPCGEYEDMSSFKEEDWTKKEA